MRSHPDRSPCHPGQKRFFLCLCRNSLWTHRQGSAFLSVSHHPAHDTPASEIPMPASPGKSQYQRLLLSCHTTPAPVPPDIRHLQKVLPLLSDSADRSHCSHLQWREGHQELPLSLPPCQLPPEHAPHMQSVSYRCP